jgi:glycosidase
MPFKAIRLTVLFTGLFIAGIHAQDIQIDRVEPPFWWTGMKDPGLQLLVYGNNIGLTTPRILRQEVSMSGFTRVSNTNYLFIELLIRGQAKPVNFRIDFLYSDSVVISRTYELKERRPGSSERRGFNSSDVIYLLMPDRFANGDPGNDTVAGMTEGCDRSNPDGRHGGDLQGVADHLDYLEDLGITALWMNPFVENNNPKYSYHGYAITDFYRTDPRLGTNELFISLVDKCHRKGLKVIMDQILNHASIHHPFLQDPPDESWVHLFPEFTRSNFRASTIMDPYASRYDRDRMLNGWFDHHMPDLNQKDPLLLKYLIQNSIWWVEYADLDGIRLDTQPYPDREATAAWSSALFREYPYFNIVGEAWMQQESMTAYFQKDTRNPDGYNSGIPTVTDFPLYYALNRSFNEKEGWTEGLARIYLLRAQDYLYGNPENKLLFCDNHDLNRFYSSIGQDLDQFKMGMVYIMTSPGIPMIYYGTEILMTGLESQGHGFIRTDFPGGWPDDTVNCFIRAGRTEDQHAAFDFLQNLLAWRQNNTAIHAGKMIHFVPEDGIYAFFKENKDATVMVIFNNNNIEKKVPTERFAECMKEYTSAFNPLTGERTDDTAIIIVPAKSATILELH